MGVKQVCLAILACACARIGELVQSNQIVIHVILIFIKFNLNQRISQCLAFADFSADDYDREMMK